MGQSPLLACRSVWQTPLTSSWTRHSPGARSSGCLTGKLSTTLRGADVDSTIAAFWVLGTVNWDMTRGVDVLWSLGEEV